MSPHSDNDARRLQWTEPAAYKRERRRKAAAGRKPDLVPWLIALGISGLTIGACVSRNDPAIGGSWPLTIGVALAVPVGLLGFLAWLNRVSGDTVILSEKGINRNGLQGAGMAVRHWPWEEITHVSIHTVDVEGHPLRLLFAHTNPDGESGFGFALGPKLDVADVARVVEANGTPCHVVS